MSDVSVEEKRIDEFINMLGIELLEYQRVMLRELLTKKPQQLVLSMPPRIGRQDAMLTARCVQLLLTGGNGDA